MTETVLCADIGTSSLKAAIIDFKGEVLARSRKQFLLCYTHEAASEWKRIFLEAASDCFKQASIKNTDAICISGNGPTVTASTTGKTILWNEEVSYRCPSLFIPRLKHLKDNFPLDWENSSRIISGPEYLIWQLTGNAVTILPEKRFETAYWNEESLSEAGFTEEDWKKLPPMVQPGFRAGAFLLNGKLTPVYCGAPDFVSALTGTNTLKPGQLCDRAGSSEGLNLCTDRPVTGKNIRTLPSVIPGLWNASCLLSDSGSRFSAYKSKIERQTGKEYTFNQLVHSFLKSDGSDEAMEEGRKLMIETAEEVKQGIDSLREACTKEGLDFPSSMTVTGGQAGNDEWNALKAEITGMKIVIPQLHDSELLGDAVFAFTGMGYFTDFASGAQALFKAEKTFYPQENR